MEGRTNDLLEKHRSGQGAACIESVKDDHSNKDKVLIAFIGN